MILYRVRYSIDTLGKEMKAKEFDSFEKMKEFAKKIAAFTNRMVYIDWTYSSDPGVWILLRACPTVKDINNVKPKH